MNYTSVTILLACIAAAILPGGILWWREKSLRKRSEEITRLTKEIDKLQEEIRPQTPVSYSESPNSDQLLKLLSQQVLAAKQRKLQKLTGKPAH